MDRYRQLHLWITEHDYLVLRGAADEQQATLSAIIRRLIKSHRSSIGARSGEPVTPQSGQGVPSGPAA